MTFHLKKNTFTIKMKLYTTSEFIRNDISFEKKTVSLQNKNFTQLVNI